MEKYNKSIMRYFRTLYLLAPMVLLFITCGEDATVEPPKDAPKLTFSKLTVDEKDVTKEQLLQQIKEKEKAGFTIRRITISDSAFAEVRGTAPNLSLRIKKAGAFTITITLQKSGYRDITIKATIVYLATEALTFDKLTTAKSTISKDDILKQVQGKKEGFTLKSIAIGDSYKPFAEVQGTAPNLSLRLKKAGDFTAKIILQKVNHKDVTLDASFSGVPETLTFTELTTYKTTLNKDDIFKQIPEPAKTNYTLKSIVIGKAYQTFAEVKGTAPNITLTLKKLGRFKADITLSKTDYLDAVITGADFNHISENLAFPKFKTDKKVLTKTDIFNQVQGKKTGYTIKKIEVTDSNYADVNPTTYSLTLKKAGTFTIKITLEKKGSSEVVINGEIELEKIILTFNKLSTSKTSLSKNDLLAQIPETEKQGFIIKSLTVSNTSFADVQGTAPNLSLTLKKEGSFTVTLVLEKAGYFDITVSGIIAYKKNLQKVTLSFNKLSTSKTGLSTNELLSQIPEREKQGFTLKSISVSNPSFADVAGTAPNLSLTLKKSGSFAITLVLEKAGYQDAIVSGIIAYNKPLQKVTLTFRRLSTSKNSVSSNELLSQIPETEKQGFALKSVTLQDNTFASVQGTAPNFSLTLKKAGNFAITLVLEKAGYQDAIVMGVIEYNKPLQKVTLTFNKFSTSVSSVSKDDLLAQIPEREKQGFVLHSVTPNDTSFASVQGTAPNFSLTLKRLGIFVITLVLKKAGYSDAIVNGIIEYKDPSKITLSFNKLTTSKNSVSKDDLLAQIPEREKQGFTLKNIALSNASFASVQGTAPDLSLTLNKAGSFGITLTLEKSGHPDITVNGAIEYNPLQKVTLTFNKLATSKNSVSKDELLAQIPEREKQGFIVKSLTVSNPSIADVAGTAPNLSLTLKKVGNFAITLVLKKAGYSDATVMGIIEYKKNLPSKVTLTFPKLSTSKKTITPYEIFAQIPEKEKQGFTFKSITIGDSYKSFAEVKGTAPNLSLTLKKRGRFTAKIVLEHTKYLDVEITGAEFEGKAEGLTFGTLNLADKRMVTTQRILDKIPQKEKAGYTLKSISDISDSNIAEALSGASGLFILIKKKGRFTAKLVLEKAGHFEVEIRATFEGKPPKLTFEAFKLANMNKMITAQQILNQIPEKAKIGYILKSIKALSGTGIATLTGTPPTNLHIKKEGRFSATLVLEQSGHFEVEITGAAFEVLKSIFVFHKPTQTITGIRADQQTYVNTLTTVTFPDEIDGLKVKHIKGSLTSAEEMWSDIHYILLNAKSVFGTKLNNNIQTIHLPKHLETIGSYAFSDCRGLKFITLPDSVTTIGRFAFYYCVELLDINIPNSLKVIETRAFLRCRLITTMNLPNVVSIGPGAFSFCNNLKTIVISGRIAVIEARTFYGCPITSITLSDSVTMIGDFAFSHCVKLTSLTLPRNLRIIGKYAFRHCYELTSITLPDFVETIKQGAFSNCRKLTSINNIPKSITAIAANAFSSCFKLTSITLPDKVTTIEQNAFSNCSELTSMTLPKTLTTLGDGVFRSCSKLASITLPNSLTTIGKNIFDSSIANVIVTIEQANPDNIMVHSTAFDDAHQIKVPTGTANTYKAKNPWTLWASKIIE